MRSGEGYRNGMLMGALRRNRDALLVVLQKLISWLRWRIRGAAYFDPVPWESFFFRPLGRVRTILPAHSWTAGPIVIVRAPGTRLARGAIGALTRAVLKGGADLAHCDHGVLESGTQHDLRKPLFSPELLLSGPYWGPLWAVRRDLFASVASDATSMHDFMIRLSERAPNVARLPLVWAVTQSTFGVPPDPQASRAALERRGYHGTAALRPGNPAWLDISLVPHLRRSVTVVIPTRDRADLIEPLIDALMVTTDYPHLRVLLVDNDSTDPRTVTALARLREGDAVEVLASPGAFNFSRICNQALRTVDTDLVVFMNNDVIPHQSGWLEQLVANLDNERIGVVGPMLTYPDGRIQHSGTVLWLGGAAGHGFRGAPVSADGYFGLSSCRREVMAVTAACLAARTADLNTLGGFDEAAFAVDFQDVDLCLRMRKDLGLSTIVDPRIPLIHLESATRGHRPSDPESARTLVERWTTFFPDDPYYSPRLPPMNPGYGLVGATTTSDG